MALRALRECKENGCHELTRDESGFCKIHKGNLQKLKNNNKFDCFYRSRKWQNKRLSVLKQYCFICVKCLVEDNNPTPAKDVHHIVELIQNFNKRLDTDNLICLCHDCHVEVHREYDKGNKKEMQQYLKKILKEAKDLL